MAVANAVLDVIENESLMEHAASVGNHMLEQLNRLKSKYPVIGDVRGMGLFIGVEMVSSRRTKEPATLVAEYTVAKFKENHILMSTEGKYGNVLKFKPPMVFNKKNVDHFITVFEEILQDVCDTSRTRASSQSSAYSYDSVNFECQSSDSFSDEDSLISE